jgi:hypothetical protein
MPLEKPRLRLHDCAICLLGTDPIPESLKFGSSLAAAQLLGSLMAPELRSRSPCCFSIAFVGDGHSRNPDLAPSDRRKNLKDAFQVTWPIHFKHVAIVDDVMTTDCTVNELPKVLNRRGVEKSEACIIARASLSN